MAGFVVLGLFALFLVGVVAGNVFLGVKLHREMQLKRDLFRQAMAAYPSLIVPRVGFRRVMPMGVQWGWGELHVLPFGFFLVGQRSVVAYMVRADAAASAPSFPWVTREVPRASEREEDAFVVHQGHGVSLRLRGLEPEVVGRLAALFPPRPVEAPTAGFVPRRLVGLETAVYLLAYGIGIARSLPPRTLTILWFFPFWIGFGLILLTTLPPSLRPGVRVAAALLGLLPLCVVMVLSIDLPLASAPFGLFVLTFVYLAARLVSSGQRLWAIGPAMAAVLFAGLGVALSRYAAHSAEVFAVPPGEVTELRFVREGRTAVARGAEASAFVAAIQAEHRQFSPNHEGPCRPWTGTLVRRGGDDLTLTVGLRRQAPGVAWIDVMPSSYLSTSLIGAARAARLPLFEEPCP